MAFNVKSKKAKMKEPYSFDKIKKKDQQEINDLLFNKKKDSGELLKYPKLLTIVIKKEKEPQFHFLKNETEFNVKGQWHSKSHKIFKEKNAEIMVVYLDDKDGTVTQKLNKKLRSYNQNYIKEEALYSTTTPLDMTTLDLKGERK
jgi:hypothetical protein